MKKVLIISTSLRNNSNSELLAKSLAEGAEKAGNTIDFISLKGKNINFCTGCGSCDSTQKCILNDDAIEIANKAKDSDVLVFATPIYFNDMSGQLKTLLDRFNQLMSSDYVFRDVYLVATAEDSDISAIDTAQKSLSGWVGSFKKTKLSGIIRGVGIGDPGDATNCPSIIEKAYEMGSKI